jgi:nucleoside phosphorylase
MKAEDYQIGWICALPCELAAAICMLDELHERFPQPALDDNNYTLGSIGLHNITIACLPSGVIGTVSATRVAERMRATFSSLRFVLMVGIGGGVPSSSHDIRLGDVVVSKPGESPGGVIQYDFGKTVQEGRFVQTGFLSKPPDVLLKAVCSLQAQHMYRPSRMRDYLSESAERYPLRIQACNYVGEALDRLFAHNYNHPKGESVCDKCSPNQVLARPQRNEPSAPVVHYGLIASGNQVMRDGTVREQLRKHFNVLCFEMEAAGMMDTFPCLIIRGICDYADSHKNKIWQDYAAAVAAAYAKELLNLIPFQNSSLNTVTGDLVAKEVDDSVHTRFQSSSSSSPFQGLGLNLGPAPEIDHALFIGRSAELDEMGKLLLADHSIRSRHVLILGGIGGVGKTQLSLAFAKQNSTRFTSVFWLNATTETSLKSSFTQIANLIQSLNKLRQTDSTQDQEFVSNWLSQRANDQWLLIFDNHDDPDQYDIHEYYPMASHGSIIITTRCPEAIQGRKIRVGPMAQDVFGISILETRSGRKGLAQGGYRVLE